MIIATEFIPLSLLSIVSTMVMWKSSQCLRKNIVSQGLSKTAVGSFQDYSTLLHLFQRQFPSFAQTGVRLG